jgi:hypothetical protein
MLSRAERIDGFHLKLSRTEKELYEEFLKTEEAALMLEMQQYFAFGVESLVLRITYPAELLVGYRRLRSVTFPHQLHRPFTGVDPTALRCNPLRHTPR